MNYLHTIADMLDECKQDILPESASILVLANEGEPIYVQIRNGPYITTLKENPFNKLTILDIEKL